MGDKEKIKFNIDRYSDGDRLRSIKLWTRKIVIRNF
ncbi:MAG: hypothetical protein G01um10143_109 [Parcubacteria group bacterium Gr01-1014_3]|nr:MAG: hypothetical protein G01um10143_109 [Parcubacteria group bacterium Gr01-1014_3]